MLHGSHDSGVLLDTRLCIGLTSFDNSVPVVTLSSTRRSSAMDTYISVCLLL